MKKILLFLTLAVLIITVMPWALTLAQSRHTPHENPSTAETSYDISLSILLHYGDILGVLANGEYGNIDALIGQLDLNSADIPADIKFIMQTYNGLLSDLAVNFNKLDVLLNEAEKLLNQNKFDETRLKLINADKLIKEAETLLDGLDNANEQLISLLGPLTPTAAIYAVNESRARLLEAIERLKMLKAKYEAYLQELETEADLRLTLSIPNITLEIDKSQVWLGDSVIVSGILTSTDEVTEALANRKIIILLNNKAIATTTTDENGRYDIDMDIPYIYIPLMTVQASYKPEGDDISTYAPSLSNLADIETLFYSTKLTLEVPEQAYPGLPYRIQGQITSNATIPSINREIDLYWDNQPLDTLYSNQDSFELKVIPDVQTTIGLHIVKASVKPQALYNGSSISTTLAIIIEQPEIRIDNISFSVPSRKVQVKGKLISDLPLLESNVHVEMRGISTTVSTSEEGEFATTFYLPLSSMSMGSQEVKITVEPSEAWHSATEVKAKVFIINIVNIGLISVAFICIGLVIYTKRRDKPGKEEVYVQESSFLPHEPTDINIALQKPEGLKGTKAKIFKAYIEALLIVMSATGVTMTPQMTLREFLRETAAELNNATDPFTELTHLTENALYSPDIPEVDKVVRAEKLILMVKEMLQHGTV